MAQQTRCPQCQTVFRVTPEQLAARGGRVRCGVCANAFHADQNLVGGTVANEATPTTEPVTAPSAAELASDDLPLMKDFPVAPRRRIPTALWVVGVLMLLAALAGQATYFYAAELAVRDARLKPWLARYCERLGCSVQPRGGLPIDLAQTSVSPHPQFDTALRLDAVLVNRADAAQPYPLLEISLTDSEGRALARRQFTAAQYLLEPAPADNGLPPGRPVRAQVDVTNPDGRAVGYEIRLVREDNE